MAYEVDFLPVGDEGRSGDAIALRYGNLAGKRDEWRVVVIDGGFTDTGNELAEHIKAYYNTTYVDLVVSTHPDNDHTCGLQTLLNKVQVGQLWMHKPWEHTQGMAGVFKDGRVTDMSLKETLRKSLDSALEIERIARRNNVDIIEPFTGISYGDAVYVVGPTRAYYDSLLPDFRCTPTPAYTSIFKRLAEATGDMVTTVAENWNIETLSDDGATSAENNSSVILVVKHGIDDFLMFTADAGIPALTLAANTLDGVRFEYSKIKMIQVTHHGSRRNVGPTILNRLLGLRKTADTRLRTAIVSASKDGAPKHPSKKVTNAFRRRGAWVYGTMNGKALWHHSTDAPARSWVNAEPVPFYTQVEESEAEAA